MTQASAIVIGGGLLGLCSARYLHEAGYTVTLLERHGQAATEASHAKAVC